MCAPKMPTPPDPRTVAGAQTATNIGTAIANQVGSMVNQTTPDGSLTFRQQGTEGFSPDVIRRHQELTGRASSSPSAAVQESARKKLGALEDRTGFTGGGGYTFTDPNTGRQTFIPQYEAIQELSPNGERLNRVGDQTQLNLARLGRDQSGRLGDLLSEPFSLDGLTRVRPGDMPDAPELATSYVDDFSKDRKRVERALSARLEPQIRRDRDEMMTRLANQGIGVGSEAYGREVEMAGQTANDLRLQTILAGGEEQSRLAGLSRDQAIFGNSALQMDFENKNTNLANRRALRNDGMNERFALRNQPINEITALLSGSQVSNPMFTSTPGFSAPTTDFAGIMQQDFANRMGGYSQQMGARNSTMGGLFGLGGNLGSAAIVASDERVKEGAERVGETDDGVPLYRYRYKGEMDDGRVHIGPMAQEVAKKKPGAVVPMGRLLAVNYEAL